MGFNKFIMKNLIIINGTMGVGKTTICTELNKELRNSVWLDGDWAWNMNPFVVNEETKSMVIDNITHMLKNFLNTSHIENIIFNWVLDYEEIFTTILNPLSECKFNLYKFTLTCSDEVLVRRIQKDIKAGRRAKDAIKRSLERQERYERLDTEKICTDNMFVNNIVDEIKKRIK